MRPCRPKRNITHDILGSPDPSLQQKAKVPFGTKIFWSRFTWSCSTPFVTWSSFLIGSDSFVQYINFHFRIYKHLRTWLRCVIIIYNIEKQNEWKSVKLIGEASSYLIFFQKIIIFIFFWEKKTLTNKFVYFKIKSSSSNFLSRVSKTHSGKNRWVGVWFIYRHGQK